MTQEKAIQLVVEGTDASLREIGLLDQELQHVNKTLAQLRKEGKQTGAQYAEFTKRQTQLRGQSAEVRKELKNQVKDFDLMAKKLPIDSVVMMEREYSRLRTTLRKSSQEFQRSDAGKAMAKQAESLSNQINISNKSWGDFTKNIGRYEEALKGLEKQHKTIITTLAKMTDAQKASPLGKTLQQEAQITKAAIVDLKASYQSLGTGMNRTWSSLTNGMKAFGQQALTFFGVGGALYAVFNVFKQGFKAIVEYETALARVSVITGAKGEELKFISDEALRISGIYGTAATEILKIFELVGSAQPELLDNTKALISVAEDAEVLAKAGFLSSAQSVDALTTIMSAFNLEANRSGIIVDTLAAAAQRGKVPIEAMTPEIADVAAFAKTMGLNMQETTAAIQAMAEAGIPFSKLGVGLRNMLAALAETGRDDLNPALVDLRTILDTLAGEVVTAGDALRFFDKQNIAASLGLIEKREAYSRLNDEIDEYGIGQQMAADVTDTTAKNLEKAKTSWTNFVISIDQGKGPIGSAIGGLTRMFGEFFDIMRFDQGDNAFESFVIGIEDLMKLNANINSLGFTGTVDKQREENRTKGIKESIALGKELTDEMLRANDAGNEAVSKFNAWMEAHSKYADLNKKSIAELKALQLELKRQSPTPDVITKLQLIDERLDELKKNIENDRKIFVKGSIGWITQRITDLNESLEKTNSPEKIKAIATEIAGLQKNLKDLQNEVSLAGTVEGSLDNLATRITILKDQLNAASDDAARTVLQQEITALETRVASINAELERIENKAKPGLTFEQQMSLGRGLGGKFEPNLATDTNLFGDTAAEDEKFAKERAAAEEQRRKDRIAEDKKMFDILTDQQRKYNETLATLYADMGEVIGGMFSNQEDFLKEAFKGLLTIMLKYAESQIRIAAEAANAVATVQAFGNPVLLAKLVAQRILIQGLITGAFNIMRGLVQSFEEGGMVKDVNGKVRQQDGVPYRKPGSKDNVLTHLKVGEIVLNDKQQQALLSMTHPTIFGDIGVPGFNASQSSINNIIRMNNLDRGDIGLSDKSIDILADVMADRVSDAIIDKNRLVERKKLARR